MALSDPEWRKACEECVGCTPISAPTTITQPGCYYVTNNISGAGSQVILIRADNVSLDVKGHTLSLTTPSGAVIQIDPGFTGISVRNGTLSGGRRGISLNSTTDQKSRLHFKNLTVKDYSFAGLHLTGVEQVDLLDSRIVSVTSHGVMINPGTHDPFTGHFLRNTLRCANSNILQLNGLRGGIVRGNQLTGEADQVGIGVYGPANIVEGNTIAFVHGTGIDVDGAGNLVVNNTVTNAGISGIRVKSDDNRIAGNVVHGCQQSGIKIDGSRNLIEGNHSSGQQSGFGLDFVSGATNAYRNNLFRGNPGGAIQDPFGNTDGGGNIV